MVQPTKPTVPDAPNRLEPSTFSTRADAFVASLDAFNTYMDAIGTFTDQRAGDAMAAAIAGDINSLDLSQFAGRAIGVDSGGTMLEGIIFQALVKATQAQAEAGTDNDRYMTALRVNQEIQALGAGARGWVPIATKTANNDASLIFSGSDFDSTTYRSYEFVFQNMRPATDNVHLRLRPSDDGGSTFTRIKDENAGVFSADGYWQVNGAISIGMASNEPGLSGAARIYNFHEDLGAMATSNVMYVASNASAMHETSGALLQQPSVDSPLNYVRFEFSGGNIDSGSITLLGLTR